MTGRVFGHPATAKRAEVQRAAMLAVARARVEALRGADQDGIYIADAIAAAEALVARLDQEAK